MIYFTVLIFVVCSSFVSKATLSQTERAQSSTGDRRASADSEVKQGVCAFLANDYATAQQHFEKALDLDPSQKKLPIFIARALDAQFDRNVTEEKGKKTIGAYDRIIAKNQDNPHALDQALAFKANIYRRLTNVNPDKAGEYYALERETIEKRASQPSATTKIKADAYLMLGASYLNESQDMNARYLKDNRPIPPNVLEKMKPLAQKAHESLQRALSVDPNYASAWFYEKLVYIEEMKYDPARKEELTKKAMQMQDKYTAVDKQQEEARRTEDLPNKKEVGERETEKREDRGKVAEEIKEFIKSGIYKREPKIDLERLLTLNDLGLPPPPPDYDASKDEAERKARRVAKLPWKTFAPATEEFSVSMPSPVDRSGNMYSAHSEAIVYLIIPSERPLPPATSTDRDYAVLAASAFATARLFDRVPPKDDVAYEVSLVGKLSLDGHLGVQYRLKWTEYCGKTVVGNLRVYAANKHLYAIYVYAIPGEGRDEVWDGDEDDPRVSRFLQSFRIPAQNNPQKSKQ